MVPHNDAIRLDCRTIHIIRQWSPSRCSELLPANSLAPRLVQCGGALHGR